MGDQMTLEDWLNEEIEVCDKCLRACCWHGLFMCDDSAIAGTIKKKRRDLVALGLEHSDYMVVDGESEHLYVTPKPETTARELEYWESWLKKKEYNKYLGISVSKALRDTINNEIEQVKKESERLKKIIDQTEQKIVYNILKRRLVENEE